MSERFAAVHMLTANGEHCQVVKGFRDVYVVAQKLHDQVWSASNTAHRKVVLKCAPEIRLQREREILQQFESNSCIRNFIDHGNEPPFLVLEHLELGALKSSSERSFSRQDVKFIAHNVLSALASLHAKGIAHTDIKPDNILLNFNASGTRVVDAKLADCGDACDVGLQTDPRGTAHAIGAAIFRSPEALLGLKWSTPTDIWSFGATLLSLIFGRNFHIFKPPKVSADDAEFPVHVLIQQARYFGPFPLTYKSFLDEEQEKILAAIHIHIEEQCIRKPFSQVEDEELTPEDKIFLCEIMRLDPRDRPTAKELLKHDWFAIS
ncbi:uncharacterized protein RHO25_011242 [Cercospora beticola]|uniref:Protein kinase domain-containing protein n=1 Tax=Cercospora beticola TaxID=122368 RepID=A0ABZ0P4Q5_CERBT|nr:hypothetical protein RHO25_011242 [Cercospora beticola]